MNNYQREHRLAGQGAIVLCAILWSTSGLFIRLVDWHPVVLAGSRSMLAALFLLVLRLINRRPRGLIDFDIKSFLHKVPELTACGLCYAATMLFFVAANKLTASANAILLQYTAPIWAALLAWLFLKEKPHWESWCAIVLVCLGMLLVFSGGLASASLTGDILALFSGIAFGANSVVLRSRKDGNTTDIMFFAHLICALFSIPFFFIHPPEVYPHNLLSISFMGIVQVGAASALFAYGIKRTPAVQAMLTAAIEPVLNPLWVLLALGETPEASVLAGGGIILGAVVFSALTENKTSR